MRNFCIVFMVLVVVSAVWAELEVSETNRDVPQVINFQAAVNDADGMPVNDTRIIEFRIYDSLTGGTNLWSEIHYNVEIADGIFSEELGGSTAFPEALLNNSELYITFVMGGEEMSPRQKLNAVPYALMADNALNAENAFFAEEAMSIGGLTAMDIVSQDTNGDVYVMGTVTADAFAGDGSALTNVGNFDDVYVNEAGPDAMTANSADATLSVSNTGLGRGIQVTEAGADGVRVYQAGDPSTQIGSTWNNGFEVAGAEGCGLFVGRANQDGAHIYFADDDGVRVYNAGTPSSQIESTSSNGFEVAGAEGNGLYVGQADLDGVHVNSASADGVYVGTVGSPYNSYQKTSVPNGFEVSGAEGNGLYVGHADLNGVFVRYSSDNGLFINNSFLDGVYVNLSYKNGVYVSRAYDDGVKIRKAGTPTTQVESDSNNGIEVAGAEGNGLYVGQADQDGVKIYHAGTPSNQIEFNSSNGVEVAGAEGNGLLVGQADLSGVNVYSAEEKGVRISYAGEDGVSVWNAGNPTTQTESSSSNGVEVAGTEGNGLFVGHADGNGILIATASFDGLYVSTCQDDGVDVWAADDGVYAISGNSNDEWGIYTPDKISASNITTRSQSIHVRNTGSARLEAGDVVCIAGGYTENVLGEGETTVNVEKANSRNTSAVFGVVEYKVAIEEEPDERNPGQTLKSFAHADGTIGSGEYLSVIVFGLANVKTDGRSPIKSGEALTAGNGFARKVQTTEINGITVAENVGTIGKALEDSNGKETIKVFVNCK